MSILPQFDTDQPPRLIGYRVNGAKLKPDVIFKQRTAEDIFLRTRFLHQELLLDLRPMVG